MKNRLRRLVIAGVFTFVTALGATTLAQADTAPVADNTAAPFAIEDFEYPTASPFKNLTLERGDGHILLADCSTTTQIQIESRALDEMSDGTFVENSRVCFRVTSTTGYLALKLPEVFYIETRGRAIKATLTSGTETKTHDIAKDQTKSVGVADGNSPDTLVELRITG